MQNLALHFHFESLQVDARIFEDWNSNGLFDFRILLWLKRDHLSPCLAHHVNSGSLGWDNPFLGYAQLFPIQVELLYLKLRFARPLLLLVLDHSILEFLTFARLHSRSFELFRRAYDYELTHRIVAVELPRVATKIYFCISQSQEN